MLCQPRESVWLIPKYLQKLRSELNENMRKCWRAKVQLIKFWWRSRFQRDFDVWFSKDPKIWNCGEIQRFYFLKTE